MLALEDGGRVLDRVRVADLLEPAIVDHADQAFMQDVETLHMRRLVARDERSRDRPSRTSEPVLATLSSTVNIYLSSTEMVRVNFSPLPLS